MKFVKIRERSEPHPDKWYGVARRRLGRYATFSPHAVDKNGAADGNRKSNVFIMRTAIEMLGFLEMNNPNFAFYRITIHPQ